MGRQGWPPDSFLGSQILKLLKGKVVVGHALHNDFQALKYVHPRSQTRDTTYVPNLLSQPGLHTRTRVSLKDLALQLLHKKIQVRQREGPAPVPVTPRPGLWRCASSSLSSLLTQGGSWGP